MPVGCAVLVGATLFVAYDRFFIVHRQSPLGPVDISFRALSGRLKFMVRRHKFIKDSPRGATLGRSQDVCKGARFPVEGERCCSEVDRFLRGRRLMKKKKLDPRPLSVLCIPHCTQNPGAT